MRKPSSRQHRTNSPLSTVLITLSILLFSVTFSSHSQTSGYADDIRYHMPEEHVFTLPISINNAQHNIPVVRYSARQPIVKGVTIIIGDIQPNGNVDPKLHVLAKTLPDSGWHTLFVMPRFDYVAPAVNTNSNEVEAGDMEKVSTEDATNNEETSNAIANNSSQNSSPQVDIKPKHLQAPNLPYSQQDYMNFIGNLLGELNSAFEQGAGYQVIYAKGQSASAIIDLMSQQNKHTAHALVINNPYWPNKETNQLLPAKLAKLPIPVLDLISLSDNIWAKDTTNTRRVAAKVSLKSLYRQREIFGDQLQQNQYNNLSIELINWTYFLGW